MMNSVLICFIYYKVLPDMVPLCLYSSVVERTDLNVNFGIHKSVAMVSVVQEQFLYFQ